VLSSATNSPVTVFYQTNDGPGAHPASAGSDYIASSSFVTIAAGQTSKNILVPIYGDTTVEFDETFTVSIVGAANATLGAQTSSLVTITNDDTAKWTVSAPDTVEGNRGVTPVTVTISLNHPSVAPVTVNFHTVDGTAKTTVKPPDYVPLSGTLTFAPGETSHTVSTNIRGDGLLEDTEYFKVLLTDAASAIPGGVAAAGSGTVQILNDEVPHVLVNSHVGVEGALYLFKATLQQRYYKPVTLCYRSLDGTAIAPGDYTPIIGCFTIQAGSRAAAMPAITANYDFTTEPQEFFRVMVGGWDVPVNVAYGTGTIKANNT
jgi:hypothetical protein